MKTFLSFLAGVATTIFVLFCFADSSSSNEPYQFFDKPGECISDYKIKVFQALDPGYALARPLRIEYDMDFPTSTVVLLYSTDEKPFYDNQVVFIPKGYCARQVGVYKYVTKEQIPKTVPIVQIMEKNSNK